MPNAGAVLKKWYRHTQTGVGTKQGVTNANMKFATGSAPVKKLSSFYIVGDLTNAAECYVTGHGGLFNADYFLDNKTFTVPTGVTVNFYQPDGYLLGFHTGALRNGPPNGHGGTNDQAYGPGDDCPNYILTKDQGTRLGMDSATANQFEMDYASTQAVADDLGVVLVTVRNRWFHAGVTLKAAISAVRGEAPGITTFNCLFCRVRDGFGDDRWNAVGGMWDKG